MNKRWTRELLPFQVTFAALSFIGAVGFGGAALAVNNEAHKAANASTYNYDIETPDSVDQAAQLAETSDDEHHDADKYLRSAGEMGLGGIGFVGTALLIREFGREQETETPEEQATEVLEA